MMSAERCTKRNVVSNTNSKGVIMGIFTEVRRVASIGLRGYVDFTGTATRRDYWTWIAISYAAQLIIPGSTVVLLLPTISFTIRRLRDVNRSPWWIFAWPVALYFLVQSTRTTPSTSAPIRVPGFPPRLKEAKDTITGVAASIKKKSSKRPKNAISSNDK